MQWLIASKDSDIYAQGSLMLIFEPYEASISLAVIEILQASADKGEENAFDDLIAILTSQSDIHMQ